MSSPTPPLQVSPHLPPLLAGPASHQAMPTPGPPCLLFLCPERCSRIFLLLLTGLVFQHMLPLHVKGPQAPPTTSPCLHSRHAFILGFRLCSLVYFLSPSPKSKLPESQGLHLPCSPLSPRPQAFADQLMQERCSWGECGEAPCPRPSPLSPWDRRSFRPHFCPRPLYDPLRSFLIPLLVLLRA